MRVPSAHWLDPLRHPVVGSVALAAVTAIALWFIPRPMLLVVMALIVVLIGGLLLGLTLGGATALDGRLDGPAALAWLLLALGGVYLSPWMLVVALAGQALWAMARYRRGGTGIGMAGRYVLAGTAYPLLVALALIWRLGLLTPAVPA